MKGLPALFGVRSSEHSLSCQGFRLKRREEDPEASCLGLSQGRSLAAGQFSRRGLSPRVCPRTELRVLTSHPTSTFPESHPGEVQKEMGKITPNLTGPFRGDRL